MRFSGYLRWLAVLVGATGLLSTAVAAETSVTGRQLVGELCTQCHGLQPIASVRNGVEGWRTTVYKMVQNGSQIRTRAELDAIVNYLAQSYGPAAGAMVTGILPPGAVVGSDGKMTSSAVSLPPGKGADLVKAECTLCHDLGRIVATRRTAQQWQTYTRVMLARGSLVLPRRDADSIAAYLVEHFGVPRTR